MLAVILREWYKVVVAWPVFLRLLSAEHRYRDAQEV